MEFEEAASDDRDVGVDRVQAAFETARKLGGRLARLERNGRGSAQDIVRLLAARLYLLDRAGADAAPPPDAFMEIAWSPTDDAARDFAGRLVEMYEAWARRRGMRMRRLDSEGRHVLAVTGIAAYAILSTETGVHVFEYGPQNARLLTEPYEGYGGEEAED